MKKFIVSSLKIILLTICYIICFSVASALVGSPSKTLPPEEMQQAGMLLLVASFINILIISFPVSRSRIKGVKLMLALFFLMFGIQTFMAQIETAFFNSSLKIPSSDITNFFVTGAVSAALFAPLAVFILGKVKKISEHEEIEIQLPQSTNEWLAKLIFLGVVYTIVYVTFGYYVAWQSPAVRQLYSGSTEILGFFTHITRMLFVDNPWLGPFQIFRGMLWTGLSLLTIKIMKGKVWEVAVANGLLTGALFTSFLLLPNPYMPQEVRMAHLLETSTSTFLFGVIIVYVLNYRKRISV